MRGMFNFKSFAVGKLRITISLYINFEWGFQCLLKLVDVASCHFECTAVCCEDKNGLCLVTHDGIFCNTVLTKN